MEGMETLDVSVFYFRGLQTSKAVHVLFLLSKVRQISCNLSVANEGTGHVDGIFGPLDLIRVQALWSGKEMCQAPGRTPAHAGSTVAVSTKSQQCSGTLSGVFKYFP